MRKFNRFFTLGAAAVITLSLLGGCASSNSTAEDSSGSSSSSASSSSADSSSSSASDTEANFPVTIKHAFGETVIEEKPERVATIGWGNSDPVLALGLAPVGVSMANYGVPEGETLHPWTKQAFEDLGVSDPVVFDDTDGIDFEAISDTNPDVILCVYSGLSDEEYNTLSEIAPVVPYAETPWVTDWQEQTLVEAKALGMEAEGQRLVDDALALIDEKKETYKTEDYTAAFCYITASDLSKFYVYTLTDPRANYLSDLGFKFPESVSSLITDDSSFSVTISAEETDKLKDIDLIIVYGDDALLEAMQNDPLMSEIPAVKNGAVVLLGATHYMGAASNPTVLSIPETLDEYMDMIAKALNI